MYRFELGDVGSTSKETSSSSTAFFIELLSATLSFSALFRRGEELICTVCGLTDPFSSEPADIWVTAPTALKTSAIPRKNDGPRPVFGLSRNMSSGLIALGLFASNSMLCVLLRSAKVSLFCL